MDSGNKYAVIMAGGVGSRFWPVSTRLHPKQFIDILGVGKSLLRQTYERFIKIMPAENIFVVTNQLYYHLVLEHIPELDPSRIIGEPAAKNTAPCIAYANLKIAMENPEATCIVAPSDHLILQEDAFLNIVEEGMKFCSERDNLLCLGIKPHRPDTGYGYIQFMEENLDGNGHIHKVKTFTEKPSLEIAKTFLESGDFLWNAGIFIWKLSSIRKAFEELLPEVHALFEDVQHMINTPREEKAIAGVYQLCTNISIDYGVLEKAGNVCVYPGDFGWSDLGTWASLYDVYEKDESQNAINGKMVHVYDTEGCMICVPDDRLVVVNGIKDIIIVESDKALLVCDKSREQDVKQIVTDMKLNYGDKYL